MEQLEAAGEILSPTVRAALITLETSAARVPLLEARIRELEARLGMNSTNSSLPPSSDPPGTSHPGKPGSGRRRGGQKGHPGHPRSLLPPSRVDHVVEHRPEHCRRCGGSLAEGRIAGSPHVHPQIELPPVRAEVTEHRALAILCPHCGVRTRAALPEVVATSGFGPRLSALVVLRVARFRLSRRAVRELLGDVLDVAPPALSRAQGLFDEARAALHAPWKEALREVRRSPVVGADETPWKLRGQRRWLWVGVARGATAFRIGRSRRAREREQLLGREHPGILTTDRGRAYDGHPLERRQLCWAHLRRNLQALHDRGGTAAPWAAGASRKPNACWGRTGAGERGRSRATPCSRRWPWCARASGGS